MTERQQADFERYMHIVPEKIAKYAPELIGNEDFEQDCYLHLVEYITTNATVNNLEKQCNRGTKISIHMTEFIKRHAAKWSNEPAMTLWQDIPNPYEYMRREEIHTAINEAIELLPLKSQQNVIRLRYGFVTDEPMTLDDIGSIIQRCRSRVQQIENKALRMLRNPNYKSGKRIRAVNLYK